ncbi:MAG: hypothetical protein AB7F53_03230 [Nitrososphaeraceae archaeon]
MSHNVDRKRLQVIIKENIDDKELYEIVEHLKKLDKYEINLNTYVKINFD